MPVFGPSLRRALRLHRPALRVAASGGMVPVPAKLTASRASKRERQRAAIAAVTVAFLVGASLSGYGVHTQMSRSAARAEARSLQSALDAAAALRSGTVLFVPDYGNICRRRWIDNETWTLRDGGEADCDAAAGWNATTPSAEHKVGQRMDAIRSVFQSRGAGKTD